MTKQPLASFDQRFKGSSFVRMLFDDGAEYLDFLLDKRLVQRRQRIGLIASDCRFNAPFPPPDFSTGFDNSGQRFRVGSHSQH